MINKYIEAKQHMGSLYGSCVMNETKLNNEDLVGKSIVDSIDKIEKLATTLYCRSEYNTDKTLEYYLRSIIKESTHLMEVLT